MPMIDERGVFRKQAAVATVRAANTNIVTYPRLAKKDGTTRGLLYCHGAGGLADSLWSPAASQTDLLMGKMLSGRYIVMSDDWSFDNWGKNAAVDDLLVADAALETAGAAAGGKMMSCGSMGGIMTWRHAFKNPTKVAGIAAVIPAVNLQQIRDFIPSARAPQDAAWGIVYPAVIPAQVLPSPPVEYLALAAGIQCPVFIGYANDDPLVYASSTVAFAAAINANPYPAAVCTLVDLGATGHTALTVSNCVAPMEAWLSATFPLDVR